MLEAADLRGDLTEERGRRRRRCCTGHAQENGARGDGAALAIVSTAQLPAGGTLGGHVIVSIGICCAPLFDPPRYAVDDDAE